MQCSPHPAKGAISGLGVVLRERVFPFYRTVEEEDFPVALRRTFLESVVPIQADLKTHLAF